MPPLGLLIGGIDFKQFALTLRDAQGDIPAVVMHYGVFIQNVFDFIIVAFAIFMAIKLINKLNRKKAEEPAAPPAPSKEEVLLSEIRDLLKEQNNRSYAWPPKCPDRLDYSAVSRLYCTNILTA